MKIPILKSNLIIIFLSIVFSTVGYVELMANPNRVYDSSYYFVEDIHNNKLLYKADSLFIFDNKPDKAIALYKEVIQGKSYSECQRAYAIERFKEVNYMYGKKDESISYINFNCAELTVNYLSYQNLKIENYENLNRDSVEQFVKSFKNLNEHFYNHSRTLLVETIYRSDRNSYEAGELAKQIEEYYTFTKNRTFDKYLFNLAAIEPFKSNFGDLYGMYFLSRLSLNEEFDFELSEYNYVIADWLMYKVNSVRWYMTRAPEYEYDLCSQNIDIIPLDSISKFLSLNQHDIDVNSILSYCLYGLLYGNSDSTVDSTGKETIYSSYLLDLKKIVNSIKGSHYSSKELLLTQEILAIQKKKSISNSEYSKDSLEFKDSDYIKFIIDFIEIPNNLNLYSFLNIRLNYLYRQKNDYKNSLKCIDEYTRLRLKNIKDLSDLLEVNYYTETIINALTEYGYYYYTKSFISSNVQDLLKSKDIWVKIIELIYNERNCFQSDEVVEVLDHKMNASISIQKECNSELYKLTEEKKYLEENLKLHELSKYCLKGYKDLLFKSELDESDFYTYIELQNSIQSGRGVIANRFYKGYVNKYNELHELQMQIYNSTCTTYQYDNNYDLDIDVLSELSYQYPVVNYTLSFDGIHVLKYDSGILSSRKIKFDIAKFFDVIFRPYIPGFREIDLRYDTAYIDASTAFIDELDYPENTTIVIVGNLIQGFTLGVDILVDQNNKFLNEKYNFIYASTFKSVEKLIHDDKCSDNISGFSFSEKKHLSDSFQYLYPNLDGTTKELEVLDSLFATENLYFGKQYTKETILKDIESDRKITHIGTHGSFTHKVPFIVLNTEEGIDTLYSF